MIEQSLEIGDLTGLRFLTAGTTSLGGRGDLCLWEPPGSPVPGTPLVILLHGIFGSHWAWALNGRAHDTARRLIAKQEIPPMVLAMPSDGLIGTGSGYVPQGDRNPEEWIVEEVPRVLRRMSDWVNSDSPVFIAGLSVGGYGALRLGAKYPDRFRGISSMSSPTQIRVLTTFSSHFKVPLADDDAEYSLVAWIRQNKHMLPPIRIDCGADDKLLKLNQSLHAQLDELGVTHVFEELDGGHDWDYWKSHVGRTFRFFTDVLGGPSP